MWPVSEEQIQGRLVNAAVGSKRERERGSSSELHLHGRPLSLEAGTA